MMLSFRPQSLLSSRPTSTDAAITSLQAATTHLQQVTARQATTIAKLLHTTIATNATMSSIQSSLNKILAQLTSLQPSPTRPTPPSLPSPSSPTFSSPHLPKPTPYFTPHPNLSLSQLSPAPVDTVPSSIFVPFALPVCDNFHSQNSFRQITQHSSTHLAIELTHLPPTPSPVSPRPPLLVESPLPSFPAPTPPPNHRLPPFAL